MIAKRYVALAVATSAVFGWWGLGPSIAADDPVPDTSRSAKLTVRQVVGAGAGPARLKIRARRNAGLGSKTGSSNAHHRTARTDSVLGSAAGIQSAQGDASCQVNDNRVSRISDRDRFYVADDFTVTEPGQITTVIWRGAYADALRNAECAGQVVSDSFHIRYYLDAGGVPGALIGFFTQVPAGAQPLNVVGRGATGELIAGIAAEYEYTATHGPLQVEAGLCYWIEITNAVTLDPPGSDCVWQWEAAFPGNDQGVQSPDDAEYLTNDWIPFDFAYCLNVSLGDSRACVPAPPANDDCETAMAVTGTGTFPFDTTHARTDDTAHALCVASGTAEFDADVWYCWTAPCSGAAYVTTCGTADLDTRVGVYEGCGSCPPPENSLVSCNDDRCGAEATPFQSLAGFFAVEGQQYLIRLGVFPGQPRGAGTVTIECDPPDQPNCPGFGNCFVENFTPGCEVSDCCSLVCVCDPFCCETTWDEACATTGSGSAPGCGAQILCSGCGSPSSGDCCTATPGTPGCSHAACCLAVCNADNFCCQNEWDEACATDGVDHSGNGARVLCPDLCGIDGDLDANGVVDLTDWGMIAASCLLGPGASVINPICDSADFDSDGRVDIRDVAAFMRVNTPPAP